MGNPRSKADWERGYNANYHMNSKVKYPCRYLLYNARHSAKKKGVDFNITEEDIQIPETCPVLGIPLKFNGGYRSDNSPSMDRFDNSLGYIKGNVNVISWRANNLKRDGTAEEFRSLVRWLEDNGKKT